MSFLVYLQACGGCLGIIVLVIVIMVIVPSKKGKFYGDEYKDL